MKKQSLNHKYIFGPVPSRRLGFSLGIDVIPFKTCTYDCIYCQLGRTTNKTVKRIEFVPPVDIIKELGYILTKNMQIDFITLSGSGEPTLYSKLGELISNIKQLTKKPVAVLTNGSLLWDNNVQKSLKKADLIIPSLDAGNENMFRYVNRPCRNLTFEMVVEGIIDFANKHRDKIWLEVFLLNGVTTVQSELANINSIIKRINPAKIQLNTVKRPPAESFAFSVPEEQMIEIAKYFAGNVEIITDFSRPFNQKQMQITKNEIINLLKRRPCTLDDICGGLHLHKNEILKDMEELIKNKEIFSYKHNHNIFYSIVQDSNTHRKLPHG